jgi:nicotinic acid phosphoribosyltransferase
MLTGQPVHPLALFTDLHELTILQAYVEEGMTEQATFSLFAHRLPERRSANSCSAWRRRAAPLATSSPAPTSAWTADRFSTW